MIEKKTWFQIQPLYQHVRRQAENKKTVKYVEIGTTFSLIAVFLFAAIAPTASAISKLIGEIKAKELTVKEMKTKINNLVQAQENYAAFQEKYQVLESSYPSSQEFYQSASNFSAITRESSSIIRSMNFNLSEHETTFDSKNPSYIVSMLIDGNYYSILQTIKKITESRRLMDINSIQVKTPENNQPNTVVLNISTGLFYLPVYSNEKN
ncbi:MAG TPA: type 4a pilus biogenesis protein PilO [Candidatus Woesebacteria bacterium]|jgi:Tfp pilus assembly protein PilO|nr:type 4a pilus biogenesis protein PilO [Candidatus Shapirobacteria bacterium]HOR02226.1 type 4a pilus biogenesis protein PilO [Candidatus Woesebacteria bacterium]